MKKLKGLNWKQFFVNHFEKVLFCLVIVGGLVAVATSRWSPYRAKDPQTLIANVEKAESEHKVSTWPEDKKAEFADVEDISAKAEKLLAPLNVQEFAFSESLPGMFSPVIDMQRPIGDIDWLPVEQMIADAGRVLILKMPEFDPSMMAGEEGMEGMMPDGSMPGMPGMPGQPGVAGQPGMQPEQDTNPYAPRTGGAGMGMGGMEGMYGPGAMPGMGPMAAGMGPGAGASRGGAGGSQQGRGRGAQGGGRGGAAGGSPGASGGGRGAGGAGMPGMDPMMAGMEGYGGMGMGMAQEGEGKRFVSVRGVFPLKKQEELLAEAMNLRTTAEATQRLHFLEYELERQVAQPGPDPWSGPWEDVDTSVAMDVMKESAGTEAVLYDASMTSPVFTMPLPMRGMGYWLPELVSHPALTAFSKTDLAKEQEAWLTAKIAEFKEQYEEFEKTQVQTGGWSQFAVTTQSIGMEMMSDQTAMNQLQQGFNQQFGAAGGGVRGQPGVNDVRAQIQQMITASGAYLLFRYLDFDVKPGYAYRYRVRVQVMNPAHGLEVPLVERADIAEGTTRWTEWSDPTPPTIVPKDTNYFLASIAPGSSREPVRAQFEMFQWSEETGTIVNEMLPVLPGSAIGGQQEATVIDPAAGTIEPKDVDFKTGDVLVDIDMGLNTGTDRRKGDNADYVIPDRVLLVNDWGGLEVADKYGKAEERKEFADDYKQFSETMQEYLKPAVEEGMMPGMEGMEGMEMEGMEGMGMEQGTGTGRGPGRGRSRGR